MNLDILQQSIAAKREAEERAKSTGLLRLVSRPMPINIASEQLEDILKLLPPLSGSVGPWLAGGAARRILQGLSLDNGDIDLFFFSKKIWTEFMNHLEGYEKIFVSDNAVTFSVHGFKIQLIKRRFYEDVEAVLEDFDFSVCQVALMGNQLVCTDEAYEDIQNKTFRLAQHGRTCHQTAVSRFTKYINYGFIPVDGMYAKIISKALDRTNSYAVFDTDKGDDAWYDGAPSTVNHFEPVSVSITSGVLRTISRAIGI